MDLHDEIWMQQALAQAHQAGQRGEVPVGAVLVKQGQLVAAAGNAREQLLDPTAHAEVRVLQEAAHRLQSWRLTDTTLYVTQEPCVMCAGALVHARISRLVYGCKNPKAGGLVTLYQIGNDGKLNHSLQVQGGILERACADVLTRFFEKLRQQGKK